MNKPNPELRLAEEFVRYTNRHIYLTGKAGTGRTTFLHHIRQKTRKRSVVTAPTGFAAINAGGVTLHAFFQVPFGLYVPGSRTHAGQHQIRREKKNLIRSLDLLIIDEISMVRADLLDCVDTLLRRHRRSDEPFGGVQLLMIGDLHQLPPVVKPDEWQILQQYYDSPYFFSSIALNKTQLTTIALQHIYRQSDPQFIELLNRVRDNRLDPPTLQRLNGRCTRNPPAPGGDPGCITLCPHNRSADALNAARLQSLPRQSRIFEAEISGNFPEQAHPTAAVKTEAAVKLAGIRSCQDGFSPDRYLRAFSTAAMEPPAPQKRAEPNVRTEADVGHPERFETLRQWRKSKAADEVVAQHRILHQKTLAAIARHLPATTAALKRIKGISNSLAKRIGPELTAMVGDYRRAHDIAADTPPEAPTAGPPPQATEKIHPAKSKQLPLKT